jgi:hypothetical protein
MVKAAKFGSCSSSSSTLDEDIGLASRVLRKLICEILFGAAKVSMTAIWGAPLAGL